MDDIDIGSGGLESHDLRGLSQPTNCAKYEGGMLVTLRMNILVLMIMLRAVRIMLLKIPP